MDLPPGYPAELEMDLSLRDGGTVHVRPIRPDDSACLQAFHRRLSRDSIFFRFFTHLPELSDERARYFTQIDYRSRMALVAVDASSGQEEIVAVARYDVTQPGSAEFALIVEDRFQHHGIGTALLRQLTTVARQRGLERLTGEVLGENWRMLRLVRELGPPVTLRRVQDTVHVELDLTAP